MKLYLVRHGETALNEKGCYYGKTDAVVLIILLWYYYRIRLKKKKARKKQVRRNEK